MATHSENKALIMTRLDCETGAYDSKATEGGIIPCFSTFSVRRHVANSIIAASPVSNKAILSTMLPPYAESRNAVRALWDEPCKLDPRVSAVFHAAHSATWPLSWVGLFANTRSHVFPYVASGRFPFRAIFGAEDGVMWG
jgi:hypothetical protein